MPPLPVPDPTLAALLTPDRVAVGLDAATKADALDAALALVAGHPGVVDAAALAADVVAREQLLSTGVGEGLALPHARTAAVSETVAALVTLAEPVEWGALDGAPVDLVLFFAGPETARAAHVRLLAHISTVLSAEGIRSRLTAAASAEDAVAILQDGPG